MLEATATALLPLLDELVFVGGATLPFYVLEGFRYGVRVTADVDCIVPVATLSAFHRFEERLRALGHTPCTDAGSPLCRYRVAGYNVDFMPYDEAALGFTNRWYKPGMDAAIQRDLRPGLALRLMPRPYFVASKLEAHRGRGGKDLRLSQDLEDAFRALDFPTAFAELNASPKDLRHYLADAFVPILRDPVFEEALDSALGQQRRVAAGRLAVGLAEWVKANEK